MTDDPILCLLVVAWLALATWLAGLVLWAAWGYVRTKFKEKP